MDSNGYSNGTLSGDGAYVLYNRLGVANHISFTVNTSNNWDKFGDGYWFARPADNVYNIDIYTDNSVLTMYINDICAYTQRIYGIQKNCWSINNYGGSITVSDVKVSCQ